jgi:hypothetical protein
MEEANNDEMLLQHDEVEKIITDVIDQVFKEGA